MPRNTPPPLTPAQRRLFVLTWVIGAALWWLVLTEDGLGFLVWVFSR